MAVVFGGLALVASGCFENPCAGGACQASGDAGADADADADGGDPCMVRQNGDPTVSAIAAGARHTCALDGDSRVWCWGDNDFGQLGRTAGVPMASARPLEVTAPEGGRWTYIAAGATHTCGLFHRGQLQGAIACWGDNRLFQRGVQAKAPPSAVALDDTAFGFVLPEGFNVGFDTIVAGTRHTCAVGGDPSPYLVCWGANTQSGELGEPSRKANSCPVYGSGDDNSCAVPHRIGALRNVIGAAVGGDHTCVIGMLGASEEYLPYCWGNNDRQQSVVSGPDSVTTPTLAFASARQGDVLVAGQLITGTFMPGMGLSSQWGLDLKGAPATVNAAEIVSGSVFADLVFGAAAGCAVLQTDVAYHLVCAGERGVSFIDEAGCSDVLQETCSVTGFPATAGVGQPTLGEDHGCVRIDDDVWCWGSAGEHSAVLGECGDRPATARTAVRVPLPR